jgi:hypothetical protein
MATEGKSSPFGQSVKEKPYSQMLYFEDVFLRFFLHHFEEENLGKSLVSAFYF